MTVAGSICWLLRRAQNVCAVQPSQFENRFQRAHLAGKLANLIPEIAEGAEIADAELKAITSGELMTAEYKFVAPFDFRPFCTCWFGTNHMPHTRDFSEALFRRVAEAYRYSRDYDQSRGAYIQAISIAGIISNRDCLLWSKLGLTCLHIEHGKFPEAKAELSDLNRILEEPGYEHPIETAHAQFIGLILSFLSTAEYIENAALIQKYESLGIEWPKHFMRNLASSGELHSIPI